MSKKIKIKGKCPRCGSKLEMGLLCYEFSYRYGYSDRKAALCAQLSAKP